MQETPCHLSFILLHGRGDTGKNFGQFLLSSPTRLTPPDGVANSGTATFASVLPEAKFIFPSARLRRAKWFSPAQAKLLQWFDNVPIGEQDRGVTEGQEAWQCEGLRQSREVVVALIQ